MLTKFETFLIEVMPDIQANQYLETFNLLYDVKGDELELSLNQFLTVLKDNETSVIIQALQNNTLNLLKETLSEMGVFLDEEYLNIDNLDTITNILRGIVSIETYDDPLSLYNCLEQSDDSTDILIEMITIITCSDHDDYNNLFDRINPDLMSRIKDYLSDAINDVSLEDDTPGPVFSDELRIFLESEYKGYVSDYLKDALGRTPYTLSLSSILRLYGNRLGNNENGVVDWLFIMLVSTNALYGFNEAYKQLTDKWENHFVSVNDQLDMGQKLSKLCKLIYSNEV